MLLLWYNRIHIYHGTKQNNEIVAEAAISIQGEDADDFVNTF